MDRHEQVGVLDVGHLRPLPERDEAVGVSGHGDVVVRPLEEAAQLAGDVEGDLLLPHSLGAGAGIVAAVPGVQDELLDRQGGGDGPIAFGARKVRTAGAVASTAARSRLHAREGVVGEESERGEGHEERRLDRAPPEAGAGAERRRREPADRLDVLPDGPLENLAFELVGWRRHHPGSG